jgi:hypothetical protein
MASTTCKEAQINKRATAVIQFPTAEERSSTKMNENFFKASKKTKTQLEKSSRKAEIKTYTISTTAITHYTKTPVQHNNTI